MATSSIAGYKGFFGFSTAVGQAITQLGELRNFNLSAEHAEIDATSHDSSGDREVIGVNRIDGELITLQQIADTFS